MARRYRLEIDFEVDLDRLADWRGREAVKQLKRLIPAGLLESTARWFRCAWITHGIVITGYRMGPLDREGE